MTVTRDLRVGVVGAGAMGADHIARIARSVTGASVAAVVEPDEGRAKAALATAPGAAVFARVEDALDAGAFDAVLVAVPGPLHEAVLLPVLQAGLPVLCEKPLAHDPESAWRIVEAEMRAGRPLLQVGFNRRFDPQFRALRQTIADGDAGELLLMHCVHRNPAVAEAYVQSMLITDSVVHDLDSVPWLAGSPARTVEVRYGRRNAGAHAGLREPIVVLIELDNGVLADVELSVNIQFGYQVITEAVFERGVARIGDTSGPRLWQGGALRVGEHQGFQTRFRESYDAEVQSWVDAALRGDVTGPSAWDGYQVAVACDAGVRALSTPGPIALDLPAAPAFYAEAAAVAA